MRRALRPLLRFALADLYERQRVFNLILLETAINERHRAEHLQKRTEDFGGHLDAAITELQREVETNLTRHDKWAAEVTADLMHHNDALYARVDQKLDRYRREAKDLWHRLGAFLVAQETAQGAEAVALTKIQEEQTYGELEKRYRGSEDDIAQRLEIYRDRAAACPGELLDLGCGRGEALAFFAGCGLAVRGIDASADMVARCREKGFAAQQGDLFKTLASLEEASLGGIVSFHVIEHLPPTSLERLVRLAWRALKPGGWLILETPSPKALVMSARQFWIDPTHLRPVHPASLEIVYREAGFEPVECLDLHPFPADEHLPEIDLSTLPEEQKGLADQVNRLRDLLDDLLFGSRDFAMIGVKPEAGASA